MKLYSAKEAVPPLNDRVFPMTIGHKSASVKVYDVPNRALESYTIVYHCEGRRKRQTRRNFDDAFKLAQTVALNLGNGALDILTLSGRERFVYEHAVARASVLGVELDVLVSRCTEASKIAGGSEHLIEAAQLFQSQRGKAIEVKMVSEVVRELIDNRRSNAKSELYLRDLRVRLEQRFARVFKVPIASITTTDIERFLETVTGSPRTKLNFLTAIGTLLQFAKNRGYVAENHPGISRVEFDAAVVTDIEIFGVEEMRLLLASAKPALLPVLAICAFAGLRSEEGKRLDWSQINFGEKFIEVTAKNAKTKTRRIVPMSENLRQWLLPYRKATGRVFPYANLALQFGKLAKKAGTPWKKNALRHSYISYRVAEVENVDKVALEAGNSAGVIRSSYLRMVTKTQGRRWFAIKPPTRHNVIALTHRAG